MSEYKRLTNNNLEEYDPEYDFCIDCKYFGEPNGCNRPNGTCGNYDRFLETYNRLAELEDKIENKNLIELPCKVGDSFYGFYGIESNTIFKYSVTAIKILENNIIHLCTVYDIEFVLGKNCFLTKAEAKAKLKELQEGK